MDGEIGLEELKGFEGVFSIIDMPTVESSSESRKEDIDIEITKPIEGKKYPTVGVLDSGITKINL